VIERFWWAPGIQPGQTKTKGYRNWSGLARQYFGKEAEAPWVRKPVEEGPRDQLSKEIRRTEKLF